MKTLYLIVTLALLSSLAGAEDRPNFLFVMADDCTFRDFGCYGGQTKTPHIDRLATEGMRFTRCFQSAPMCSPTRHSLYTGQYPVKTGAYPNHTFAKAGTKSVGHYLKDLGYRVALSGKRHISPEEVFPFEYSGKGNPDMAAVDKLFAECADTKKPFCLFACSNEPHTPWDQGDASQYDAAKVKLPPYFVDTPETREAMTRYLAEITYYDDQVGKLLARLEKNGLAENTLVIVVSEQGSSMPFAKWTCYDAGLQSAMIARWPGKIAKGITTDAMVEYVDVVPTFLDAAGGKPDPILDGKSFLPVLTGEAKSHKKLVFGEMTTRGIINGSETFGIRSVRSEKFKYIINFTPEIEFRNICMKSPEFLSWIKKAESGDADAVEKVRRYKVRAGEELYAVADGDWYEWHNLADDPVHAETKAALRKELLAWMERCGDEGQATEATAHEHQKGWKNRNKKKAKKKP